jgi:hypothetical protein
MEPNILVFCKGGCEIFSNHLNPDVPMFYFPVGFGVLDTFIFGMGFRKPVVKQLFNTFRA